MSATVAVVGRGFGAAVHAPGWELAGAHVVGVAGREDWRDLVEQADVVSVAVRPRHTERSCSRPSAWARGALREAPRDDPERRRAPRGAARGVPTRSASATGSSRRSRASASCSTRTSLRVLWTTGSRLQPGPPGWKDDPQQGGALSAYGVHALDYARWMLGRGRGRAGDCRARRGLVHRGLAHEDGRPDTADRLARRGERVHRLEAGDLVLENRTRATPSARSRSRTATVRSTFRRCRLRPGPIRASGRSRRSRSHSSRIASARRLRTAYKRSA